MKKNDSLEVLKNLSEASSLKLLWLAVPLFFTLIPSGCMFFPLSGFKIEWLIYTNILALSVFAIPLGFLIYKRRLALTASLTILNIAFVLWWVSILPLSQLTIDSMAIGVVIGTTDIIILTIILACRMFRTINIQMIYNSFILYLIQVVYIMIYIQTYGVKIFSIINDIAI